MLTFKKPYSDDILVYDEITERYVLNISYAKSKVESPYQDDGIMTRRLNEISETVYSFMYNLGNTNNRKYTQLVVNYSDKGRKFITKALLSQLYADADNGYNDLSKQNPINFQGGKVIDRNDLRKNKVCVNCEDIIKNSMADLDGYNVCYMLVYNNFEFDKVIGEFNL